MRRRSLLLLAVLSPAAFFTSRYLRARTPKPITPTDDRELAVKLNELASLIATLADARFFVDFVADMFVREIPRALSSRSLRDQIAQAEFSAVSSSQRLIPELRLAEAWNAYVGMLQVPVDRKVTPAEIHNLRDAFLTTSRFTWDRGSRSIWVVPTIYATQADGKLASGCRAVESIRILWDLANMPDNLDAARDRVNKGVLFSDLIREAQSKPHDLSVGGAHMEVRGSTNLVQTAQRQYVADKGVKAFNEIVVRMLKSTLT